MWGFLMIFSDPKGLGSSIFVALLSIAHPAWIIGWDQLYPKLLKSLVVIPLSWCLHYAVICTAAEASLFWMESPPVVSSGTIILTLGAEPQFLFMISSFFQNQHHIYSYTSPSLAVTLTYIITLLGSQLYVLILRKYSPGYFVSVMLIS